MNHMKTNILKSYLKIVKSELVRVNSELPNLRLKKNHFLTSAVQINGQVSLCVGVDGGINLFSF